MAKTHEFYPMISGTMKALLNLATPDKFELLVYFLVAYPHHDLFIGKDDPLVMQIIAELDRQYARWNKKGAGNENFN